MLEICCLGSGLSDFDSHSWRVAREYDFKIIKDIEQGFKTWEKLDKCIDPTAWTYARELVPKSKAEPNQNKNQQNSNQKLCTTYNSFRKEGCSYEHNNPGEKCVYLHFCSNCRQKGFPNRRHKAINCRDEGVPKNTNSGAAQTTSNTNTATPSAPVVTSV